MGPTVSSQPGRLDRANREEEYVDHSPHIRNLIFIGGMSNAPFYPEERRFVEELSVHFNRLVYLSGIGLRGLRPHQVVSMIRRLRRPRRGSRISSVENGSLFIVPERRLMGFVNETWLRHQLMKVARHSPNDWAIWIRFPSKELVAAVEGVPFARVVYEPIDPYPELPTLSPNERKLVRAAEQQIIKRATVITAARAVSQRLRSATGDCYWLPLGMDQSAKLHQLGLPPAIGRPRLLIIGSLDWRIDQSLVADVGRLHPEWQLILVGPRAVKFRSEITALPNVHFMGPVPTERALSVIAECDVGLIPYYLTEWTRATLPLKVFDYLSAGKAIVSTLLPELSLFGDVVDAVPRSEFIARIERVLAGDDAKAQERRRLAVAPFTIRARASRAVEIMDRPLQQKTR